MDERTASSFEGDDADDGPPSHPTIEGYTLVTTPPLPPFLRGGFGRVYRALTPDGVLVAIKVSLPANRDAVVLDRWRHECQLSLALPPHEHVVRFMARTTARWPDGHETPALVMEWLEGARGLVPYADALGLDKQQRLDLFEQALDGVAWLHAHHTPHCDLKSSNMLVIERRSKAILKITDFGGTRRAGRADPSPPVYSPHRVAPEVVSGDPAAIDARVDVFALGKELAELIGGAEATRTPPHHRHRDWRPLPVQASVGLSDRELDAIIARATSVERTQRFADAQEMLDALRAYRPPRRERWTRRVEHWLWPLTQGQRGRTGRPLRVLAILAIACAAAALPLVYGLMSARLAPELAIQVPRPPTIEHVAIFRGRDTGEMARIAAALGIEGVLAEERATWRRVWARVIERVIEAGPKAIVFDVALPEHPDESLNAVMGEAIAGGRAAGVPIVVAVTTFEAGMPTGHRATPSAGMATAILGAGAVTRGLGPSWGCFIYDGARGLYPILWLPQGPSGEVRLPLAVAAVAAMFGGPPPVTPVLCACDSTLTIPGHRVIQLFDVVAASDIDFMNEAPGGLDLANDQLGIYPFMLPEDDEPLERIDHPVASLWSESLDDQSKVRALIRDRVVLLAAYSKDDEAREIEPGRFVPGVWIHAAAIESLLTGLEVPRTPPQTTSGVRAAIGAVAGMVLALLVLPRLLRAAGLAMPSLAGRWIPSRLPPLVAARRSRRIVLGSLVGAAVISVAWLVAPFFTTRTIPDTFGLLATGVFVGVCTGAAAVFFAAWMGLVRRAWCLDRAPDAVA